MEINCFFGEAFRVVHTPMHIYEVKTPQRIFWAHRLYKRVGNLYFILTVVIEWNTGKYEIRNQ